MAKETQEWYCKKCDKPTTHWVIQTDTVNFGIRRKHECEECHNTFETFQLRHEGFVKLRSDLSEGVEALKELRNSADGLLKRLDEAIAKLEKADTFVIPTLGPPQDELRIKVKKWGEQ
jgi:methionyl-tRNA synthetase